MMVFDWMIWESNSLWILKISLYLNRLIPKLPMWRSKKRPLLKIGGKHENPLLQENLLSKKSVSQVLSTITRDSTITRYTITRGDCIRYFEFRYTFSHSFSYVSTQLRSFLFSSSMNTVDDLYALAVINHVNKSSWCKMWHQH